jgi:putative Holliday junction resolvase
MNEQCLGIDWGEKRIGLAIGNSEVKLASPLGVAKDITELKSVILKEKIDRLVLGEPVNEEVSKDFLDFKKTLEQEISLPISLIDERFSSQAADSLDPHARRDGKRDEIAAMIILQSYFDGLL